ncbi:hypothetical protein WKT22_00664 [Candidatus Lokiarchaeum ossiferum]
MVMSTLSIVLGITSLIILILNYTYAVLFSIKFYKIRKNLVRIVAIVAFCCGSFMLGPSVSFLSLIFTGENIPATIYYVLSYATVPIVTIGIIIMTFSIVQPKYQKYAVFIWSILGLIYWIFMFGFTASQFSVTETEPGELIDINHESVSLIITGLSLITSLIVGGGGFVYLSRKFKKLGFSKKEIRKSFLIGIGWMVFVILGILEALIPPVSITFVIINRMLMFIAFNFVFMGYWSKPTKLQ